MAPLLLNNNQPGQDRSLPLLLPHPFPFRVSITGIHREAPLSRYLCIHLARVFCEGISVYAVHVCLPPLTTHINMERRS